MMKATKPNTLRLYLLSVKWFLKFLSHKELKQKTLPENLTYGDICLLREECDSYMKVLNKKGKQDLVTRALENYGPMVYGTCYSPISKKEELKDLNFADSKTLTEEKREEIFEMLDKTENLIGWMIEILSPTFISNSMLRRFKYNLNALSHDCAIGLIQKVLDKGVNVQEVYVDTVGDPGKYQAKLKEIFPQLDITVAAKADADFQIVGAASICAKVARDKAVKNWKFIEGLEFKDTDYGSGYPSDPVTKKFMASTLDKVFGFPQFVRVSWSTAYSIIDKKGVVFRWEDDDEEDENLKSTPKLSAYFNKKDERDQRHRFFKDRCLQNVSVL